MERVAQPAPVEEVLDRSDRSEQRRQPSTVERHRTASPSHRCSATSRASSRATITSLANLRRPVGSSDAGRVVVLHRSSTRPRISGITFGSIRRSSWIRPLWRLGPAGYISSCPKGQVRTARPHRGVILGTVPGTGFEGRKASERGTWAERRDSGLVRSRCESTGRSSHQFLRALSCAPSAPAALRGPATPATRPVDGPKAPRLGSPR